MSEQWGRGEGAGLTALNPRPTFTVPVALGFPMTGKEGRSAEEAHHGGCIAGGVSGPNGASWVDVKNRA